MANRHKATSKEQADLAYTLQWEKEYQRLLRRFLKQHRFFSGNEVCAYMRAHGLTNPKSHNHWGAQITYYAGQKFFVKRGHAIPNTPHTHIKEVAYWESKLHKNFGK